MINTHFLALETAIENHAKRTDSLAGKRSLGVDKRDAWTK